MFASGNRMTDTEDRPGPGDIRSSKVLPPEVGSKTLTPAQHIWVPAFPSRLARKVSWLGNGAWPRPMVLRLNFMDYFLSDPTVDMYTAAEKSHRDAV